MVQEINWSHDQMFLAAAIHDSVVFFDMKKLLRSTYAQPFQARAALTDNQGQLQPT
jgi:hypothetical protein